MGGVVQCVEAYARMSELRKAVFLLIAHQCEVDALLELREIFTHFDVKNRGSLSTDALRHVLAGSGMGPLAADRVIHALDRNRDGYVSWTEFIAAAICVSVCRRQQLVDAAFATFDTDQDDQISAADILKVLTDQHSREEWEVVISELFREVANGEAVSTGKFQPFAPAAHAFRQLSRVFGSGLEVRASKEQFRHYIGQKLDFRAGDALYAVT